MSNVKVNGNIYNDITSVKLMKSDESGYAEYVEGAEVRDSLLTTLLDSGSNLGDIGGDDAAPCLEWLTGYTMETVSFPYATTLNGVPSKVTAENLLFPNVSSIASIACGKGGWRTRGFTNCKITGVLDLSSLDSVMNNACQFTASEIGTLKLGAYAPAANIWNGAIFTNLVLSRLAFDGLTETAFSTWFTYFNGATITNLYVPTELVSTVQEKIDEGKLTKITNLYSVDDWEG